MFIDVFIVKERKCFVEFVKVKEDLPKTLLSSNLLIRLLIKDWNSN